MVPIAHQVDKNVGRNFFFPSLRTKRAQEIPQPPGVMAQMGIQALAFWSQVNQLCQYSQGPSFPKGEEKIQK